MAVILDRKLKVVFIGGCSRSGSTLLDLILGQGKDCFSLGEMYHIWQRGFVENQLCGCGMPFHSCSFWRSVIKEVSASVDLSDLESILKLQRSVARFRHLPLLAVRSLRSEGFNDRVLHYTDILKSLYQAIARVSGCGVLVDSSKLAAHGFILSEISDIELYVLHLVRDSRAVIHSWQRKKRRPEVFWKESLMPNAGLIKGTQIWLMANLLVGFLSRKVCKYKIVRYEDLASCPRKEAESIIRWLGLKCQPDFFLNDDSIDLGPNHTVSGNPLRFRVGSTRIRPDMEWKQNMPRIKQKFIYLVTYLLLARFGQTGM